MPRRQYLLCLAGEYPQLVELRLTPRAQSLLLLAVVLPQLVEAKRSTLPMVEASAEHSEAIARASLDEVGRVVKP